MDVTMDKDYKCTNCGGDVEIEEVKNNREWVCVNCGSVVEMEATIVEAQTVEKYDEENEVEEL